jgi:L-amino acid N-acyltransferase YncA
VVPCVVSDEVIIRPAVRGDVPGILLIYNAAVREPAAAYEDVPHTLAQREEWFDHFAGRNFPILVAESNGVIVGWGSLGPHQERMGFRFTGAVAVYVAARFRRQGIGGRLLESLLVAGHERQLHVVLATIDAANEPSLQLHARHGFTQAGVFPEAGCKFGEWRDVIYLQRKLDDRPVP